MLHEHDKSFARWWAVAWICAMAFFALMMEVC